MTAQTAIAHVPSLSAKQMALVHQTIAKDCNREEFDLFMEAARSYGLDPFRKQIMPLVFSKDKPDKRRMSIVVARDGLRVIASRCRNYRPASEPAEWVIDEALKGPLNPKGLVHCTVYLWQQDNRGEWFRVKGEADWDEFAPVVDEWAYDDKASKRKPTGGKILDPSSNWYRMPKVMLEKCAEAQALRAGWPEQFGGLYAEEEMDRARVLDLTASEVVDLAAEERRLLAVEARDKMPVTWGDAWGLEFVPIGQFADRVMEWLRTPGRTEDEVSAFQSANRETLRLFWAKEPNDALALKRELEGFTAAPHGRDKTGRAMHPLEAG